MALRGDVAANAMQQYMLAKTTAEADELNEGHVDPEPQAPDTAPGRVDSQES